MSLGRQLVSVHMILKFKQSDWLKKYTDFSTGKRKNAANGFEKYFFKLMNNSTFCKIMENLRKIINVRLVNNAKDYKKWVSRPILVWQKTIHKNFVAIHEIKPVLTLDKPIYIGFSIADLSKLLMYEFHYKDMKQNMMLNCYLQTQTVYFMKLKQSVFVKILLNIRVYLILVTIHRIQSFLIMLIKRLSVKYKMNSKEK